ncbi:NAD-dependent epimerase/dehydratase family protein [Propionicicella superfundia]|uniref:NAD-dependent epimerase/dehydratase family protein n=1 Tax=Propionicicella superfundia TaxID=348582 RepID=UPI0003FE59DF|nr:NAD-dependent epimerase/dehydratase family protein [Propionicicella superfundia]
MGHHLVVGAGGIGRATAQRLRDLGQEVTVVSRSGPRNLPADMQGLALDITDAGALAHAAEGAASIVNAVNPAQYWRWSEEWPPMADAFLAAAERSGAGLVTVGNLYPYGPVDGPMREDTPERASGAKGRLRASMWRAALNAHEQGRVRATELRASDYTGPGAGGGQSFLNTYAIVPAIAGKAVRMPMGDVDVPHSWTYLPDIGALAAALATGEGWGRLWHVPTEPARSVREVVTDIARLRGTSVPKVSALPRFVVTAGGVFSPLLRELRETRHQFERPFVLDSSAAQDEFGLTPTPWEDQLRACLADPVLAP